MTSLCLRLVILVTVLIGCDPDLPAIEQRLKEDKSRPGKVGTLRALEVIHHASRISSQPCKPVFDLDFQGEFTSDLSIHLHRRNGETFRRLNEKRTLSASDKISKLTTDKRTIDELGIEHHMKRTWIFDGKETIVTSSIGHGEISGPRRPRSDEKAKIFAAALSSFRAFRAFNEPECVSAENQSLEKIMKEITIDKSEFDKDAAIINWRAMSDGREIEVKYNHSLRKKNVELSMPKIPESERELTVQTSGFGSARALIEKLKKEKLIE